MRCLLLLLVLLVAGCSDAPPTTPPEVAPSTPAPAPCETANATQTIGSLVVTPTLEGSAHGWHLNATICNNGPEPVTWQRDNLTCRIDWNGWITAANGTTYWTHDRQNAPNAGACPDTPYALQPGASVAAYDGWSGVHGYTPERGLVALDAGEYVLAWEFVPDVYAPETLRWEWGVG